MLKSTPVIALTATATPGVRQDILNSLNLIQPIVTVTSFDRPNLYITVSLKSNSIQRDLKQFMVQDASSNKFQFNGPTIIYCQTKKNTEEIIESLKMMHIECAQYHAGLKMEERKKSHVDFINDRISVIAATIAFGMGIDKPDIRNIIHYGTPKEMESYYQEIGRAGRDGEPSKCHILYAPKDYNTIMYFLNDIKNPKFKQHKMDMFEEMKKFLTTNNCRRRILLNHFEEGNQVANDSELFKPDCCDNCTLRLKSLSSSSNNQLKDFTNETLKFIKVVKILNERSPITTVVAYLLGSKSQKTAKLPDYLLKNELFGSGKSKSEAWWKLFGNFF